MSSAQTELLRRYPGLKPFERRQSPVFHGRSEDALRLADLIMRERLVVLFSKSGIGKTSLLKAGVAPRLEPEDFTSVFLRCENTRLPLLESIGEMLRTDSSVARHEDLGLVPGAHQTLWEQIKRLEFEQDGLPATPVLVFDQFEEVFTLAHTEESRTNFLKELADVVNLVMPPKVRADLLSRHDAKDKSLTNKVMQWWEQQPDLRIVLSIRSDFLHLLDQTSTLIPGILRNRYQLLPLNREQATEAITVPAQAPGIWATQPFTYTPEALREMIDYLAGKETSQVPETDADDMLIVKRKDEIESFNLQIVCQDIEEKIIEAKSDAGFVVSPDFYERRSGLERSIRHFYSNQLEYFPKAYKDRLQTRTEIAAADQALLSQAPEVLREKATRLIEENLVTPGNRRNSVVDDTLLTEYGISPDFLDTLVDKSRLLRKEPRIDDFYYEISHDTLLPAVIESRDRRRQREQADLEKARLEARFAEDQAARAQMTKEIEDLKMRRNAARKFTILMVWTAAVMLLFTVWVAYNWVRGAVREMELADFTVSNEAYEAGIEAYEELNGRPIKCLVIRRLTGRSVAQEMNKALNMQRIHDSITVACLALGDSLFFRDQYAQSLNLFRQGYALTDLYNQANDYINIADQSDNTVERYIKMSRRDTTYRISQKRIVEKFTDLWQRREFALSALIAQFRLCQRDAETFQEAQVWPQVLRNFRQMKALLPEHPDDLRTLQKALNLGAETPVGYVERGIALCESRMR
jgi:hypothetical protein